MLYSFASAATKTATKLKETVDDKLDKVIISQTILVVFMFSSIGKTT